MPKRAEKAIKKMSPEPMKQVWTVRPGMAMNRPYHKEGDWSTGAM